ncbi:MAG: type II secretion system protein GspK [Candidatus Omnitrophica bacterium]|nr:type II secretion system protein GspK [Candidatus Omnitrophota bacterium]
MLVEVRLSRYYRDKTKAYYLARGYLLKLIEDKKEQNALLGGLYFPYDDPAPKPPEVINDSDGKMAGQVTHLIIDEHSKINVNKLINTSGTVNTDLWNTLKALLEDRAPGINDNDAEDLVKNLVDWIDKDEDARTGASSLEKDLYKDYTPENKELSDPSTILLVNRWNEEIFNSIIDFITIYSSSEKININSCSKEALAAVLKAHQPQNVTIDTDGMAHKLIDFRAGGDGKVGEGNDDQYFGSDPSPPSIPEGAIYYINNIPNTLNLSTDASTLLSGSSGLFSKNILATGSDILRFEVEADVRGIKQRITAIVNFSTGKIIYWQEE